MGLLTVYANYVFMEMSLLLLGLLPIRDMLFSIVLCHLIRTVI
jgi:hypothetical protein